MKKKNTAQTAASVRRQKTAALNAVQRAARAIIILRDQLPDPDAAAKLGHLFVQLAGILSSQLGTPAKSAMPAVDMDVVKAMVRLSNSLLDHLHANPQQMIPLLEYSEDWPAVASVIPARDARRVLKYPETAVAELYKPVAEHLGTGRFFPPVVSRNRGIFHEIAEQAAQAVYVQSLLDSGWREQGLPGFFDFIDHQGVLQQPRFARPQDQDAAKVDAIFQHYAELPRKGKRMLKKLSVVSVPRPEQKSDEANADTVRRAKLRESLIALKYYLELASAPEPRRTQLRNNWRALRMAKFAALKPADKFGKELHRLLMKQPPRATADPGRQTRHGFSPYGFSWTDSPGGIPLWARWWAQSLGEEPALYFGNRPPLTEWDHPSIRRLAGAKPVANHPNSGFGRCVNAILDAYLHLCGVTDGIEEFQSRQEPLPKAPSNPPGMDEDVDDPEES